MKLVINVLFLILCAVNINAQIDFSKAIRSVQSGSWSDSATWSTGRVPSTGDDVEIMESHSVYIDVHGSEKGEKVNLCRHLKINEAARLSMGHDKENFDKELVIGGSIECQGTFSSGRQKPEGTGDGSLYKYNSRIYLELQGVNTYITGSGYFHPGSFIISNGSGVKNVIIDVYNIVTDEHFVVNSDDRVTLTTDRYSYIHVKGTLGITGGPYMMSSPAAKADLVVDGLIACKDLSLYTKNTVTGATSSITVNEGGCIYTSSINEGELNINSEAGGFTLSIAQNGLFRLGKGIDLVNLTTNNPHFTLVNNGEIRNHYSETLTASDEIVNLVNQYKPSINEQKEKLRDIFGSSHIAGWYHFTDKPFLTEGLDYYEKFGSSTIKTALNPYGWQMKKFYPFNHNNWKTVSRLAEVLLVPEIQDLFSRPNIKTHTFWVTTQNRHRFKDGPDFNNAFYSDTEEQFYELTVKLLETYGHLEKTFIYQNWEGDWILRGKGVKWENDSSLIPDDINWQLAGMARWFRACQRGTERARNEFPTAKARVLNGIELNKLWMKKNGSRLTMMDNNTPCVAADIIPHCRIDISSWSAYDGAWENNDYPFPSAIWTGLEIINYFTTATGKADGFPVQIGEFAINENPRYARYTRSQIRTRYDLLCGLALAIDLPYFYLWNLYCSGQQGPDGMTWQKGVEYETEFLYEWLDGKWVLEPDGTWGYAAEFLMEQFGIRTRINNGEPAFNEISVYPNPAENFVQISDASELVSVDILNGTGKTIKRAVEFTDNRVDISDISDGYYILKVRTGEQVSFAKILKN